MNSFKLLLLPFLLLSGTASAETPDQARIDALLKQGRTTYDNLRTYTAVIDRTELIGRRLREQKGLITRFRKPGTILVRFTSGPDEGTEALYDPARFGTDMSVRKKLAGRFVTLRMNPLSPVRLGQERHSITDSDIGHLLGLIEEHVRLIRSTGLGSISYDGEKPFDARKTYAFTARFPEDKRFYGGLIRILIDAATGLPVRAEVRGWKDELWESYEYRMLRIDPALADADFAFQN